MYDTFLDLSKLDLSEDSGECQEVGSDAHESDNLISTDQGESEAECNATKNSSNEPHPADGEVNSLTKKTDSYHCINLPFQCRLRFSFKAVPC